MEMEKPKSKKKQKRKDKKPEKVPLHDILNTDSAAEEGTSAKPTLQDVRPEATTVEPQKKKKKGKKNVISPDVASSVITVEEGTRPSSAASSRPDAWTTEGEPSAIPETPTQPRGERPASRGVVNPALVTADEPSIPGSVPNLQDESLDSLPAITSPVANSTVIEDDTTGAPDIPTPEDMAQQADLPETPKAKPSTPKSTPSTPASKFHRTLFGRPKSAVKVAPSGGKENQSRPSTAPGRRLPFVTDYTPSPSQKRPATAAAMSPRQAKSGRMDGAESQRSLRSNSVRGSMRSVKDVTETTAVKQAVAYVPYSHARNALTRVIDDMKSMKMNHLSIVAQIEEHYQSIENESKDQFNSFVISLQDEQKEKLNTFRQTLETHNVDVKDRNKYWTETVQSLSKRNKELLRQKRALLLAYRTDTQKLEEERNALQAQLLGQIGEQDSKLRRLEGQLEDTRDESKILSDEADSEKVILTRAVPLATAVAVSSRKGAATLVNNEAQTEGDFHLGGIAVGHAGESKWKERYEKEKENHTEETERLEQELQKTKALLASSGSSTEEEKKAYEDKLLELTKDLAKTKAQYDATYAFLQAIMAATDSEEQYQKAMQKIASDRTVMKEEQDRIQSEIQEWEEKWKKDHRGSLPSEEERPENAQELFTQMAEVDQMMSNLDQQEKALVMLKRGQMPEVKEAPEPIVTTVKIRDPDLVAEMETYKSRMSFLENKMKSTQDDLARVSDLENQNTDLLDKLQRYEMELDAMRRSPVPVAAVALAASATKERKGMPDREAALLLAAVLKEIGVIHGYGDAESWKAPHKVEKRMKELFEQEEALLKKREVESSDDESSGESPDKKNLKEIQLSVSAVKVIKSGDIPEDFKAFMHADASDDVQMVQDELDDARREIETLERQLADVKTGGFSSMEVEDGGDVEEINQKISEYQKQTDELEEKLREEREVSDDLRAETGRIRSELDQAKAELEQNEEGVNARVVAASAALTVSLADKEKELKEANDRVEELEKARLKNLDVDSRAEIERAQKEVKKAKLQVTKIKKEKEELELQIAANAQKIKSLDEKIAVHVTQEASYRAEIESARKGKQKAVKDCETKFAEKEKKRKAEDDAKVKMLENKIRRLEAAGAAAVGAAAGKRASSAAASDPNADRKIQRLEAQVTELKKQKTEDQNRIKELDRDLKEAKSAAKSAAGDKEKKLIEKKVKDLEKKLETETKKFERELKRANELAEELEQLKKEFADLEKNNKALAEECAQLNVAAEEGAEAAVKVGSLEKEVKQLTADNKTLTDNYTSERVLRKKYYNMVEDMKGKIRVYCRYRPMSKTERANGNQPVVKAPDEYTVQVEARGQTKEFQFDQIFTNDNSQEDVFEDTFNLVQSAVDGYNVCIFAYGQTGSGKTYTMIGDRDQTQPGIAPRAFRRIFDLIEENKGKMKFQV